MPLTGVDVYKDNVRELVETDPAHPTTWNPIHQDLINNDVHLKTQLTGTQNEIATARAGEASLNDRITQLQLETSGGSDNFGSEAGTTITHNIGHTNYRVRITPTADPGGYLGEVWVVKAANTFVVYNSGKWTGGFDWQILT